jgi:hypothetical protein
MLLVLGLAGPAYSIDGEGFDLMRQITSQWVKPNIMLVLDESGSMAWPVERGSTSFPFEYVDGSGNSYYGAPQVNYDYSYTNRSAKGPFFRSCSDGHIHPNTGIGHGYWLLLDREIDWSKLNVVKIGSEISGQMDSDDERIKLSYADWDDLDEDDLIKIWDFNSGTSEDGYYEITNKDRRWSNSSWSYVYYIEVREINWDMRCESSDHEFSNTSATLKLQRIRLGVNDQSQMENDGLAKKGFFDASNNDYLYVWGYPGWMEGDLVKVSGLPDASEDGLYMIQTSLSRSSTNDGYYYFQVSALDSNGTWDWQDSSYSFSSSYDEDITIQRVMPASKPLPTGKVWYYIPPSRMAITKNVLGGHLWIYEVADDLTATGTDDQGRKYYSFASGSGPDQGGGAYFDWYLKAWINWDDEYATHAPIPDHNVSDALEPTDLVDEFSDVINWGLVSYSGSCDTQDLRVNVNPDDSDQLASVLAIEGYLDAVGDGGLQPGGGTPTRAALERAMQGLLTGWTSSGTYQQSTWDRDTRRTCDRTYGVILMTDGQSNNCNTNDSSWGSCPSNPDSYPAGRAEDLWEGESSSGTFLTHIRTWVIGVSQGVGRCELNYTAYKGRTDASSPNNDAGYDTAADPRLPEGSPGTYDSSKDYAYFTNSAEELKDAYTKIVTSMGAGGYATGAPSVSPVGGPSGGALAFLGSTYYPTWEGHLRAFDLTVASTHPDYLVWDAAATLSSTTNPNGGFARRIYSWDPGDKDLALIEIDDSNVDELNTLCGDCGFTEAVIDFIKGNDGNLTDTMRELQLGPVVNSTPTVIGRPQRWDQNTVEEHASFESAYSSRTSLVYVGTSDGTIRAFDLLDGAEILCLIPPDLLDHQVALYLQYLKDPNEFPLGQPQLPSKHKYGIANSIRFGDIYFSGENKYKTVMFVSEGPGGTGIHAIDVTHPYPGRTVDGKTYYPDPNYGYGTGQNGDPVKVLWSITADGEADTKILDDLGFSWSMPAFGPVAKNLWRLQVGAGYVDNAGNFLNPRVYHIDPIDGSSSPGNFTQSSPLLPNASSYWVTNQTFADSVYWQNYSSRWAADNIINEGIQGDLNGHMWLLTQKGNSVSAETLLILSDPEPFYYSPAVSGYPEKAVEYSLYAFASGSYYETSPNIVGSDVGTTGNFIPKIYVVAREIADPDNIQVVGIPTGSLPDPEGGTLGPRTQPTSPPSVFANVYGTDSPFALFLLYDPDATACIGYSYIVRVNFEPMDLDKILDDDDAIEVYKAGEGTAGGFAITGEQVIVAQSDPTEDGSAKLVTVPNLIIPVGGGEENVRWYVELQ